MVLNIIAAILILSIIVIIHEFGHFIIAKANGVEVTEFFIGFGPKIIKFKKGGTEYSLRLLPFGGACVMLGQDFMDDPLDRDDEDDEADGSVPGGDKADGNAGEDDRTQNISEASGIKVKNISDIKDKEATQKKSSDMAEKERLLKAGYDESKSFANKSVWSRIAIIAAGPFFNFLLAFILALIVVGSTGYDPCTVDKVYDNSPATEAGLQEGDRIVKVNGENITFAREYSFYRYYHAAKTMNITYERDGQKYTTTLTPQYSTSKAYKLGITISTDRVVNSVNAQSPAEKAGIKSNDVIKSVNGTELETGTQLSEIVSQTQGAEVDIVVVRNGEEHNLKVIPELIESEAYNTGFVSYGIRQKTSLGGVIRYSFHEVSYVIKTVIKSLGMMFTGQTGVNDLMGPVGTVSTISSIMEESKADGAFYVFLNAINLAMMISANLGIMNLVPIPALDGGRLIFLIIEAVRGKPVKKEHEGMVHFVGMVLLMILMVYVLFKDISGLF